MFTYFLSRSDIQINIIKIFLMMTEFVVKKLLKNSLKKIKRNRKNYFSDAKEKCLNRDIFKCFTSS